MDRKVERVAYVMDYKMFRLKDMSHVPEEDYEDNIDFRIFYNNKEQLNTKIKDLIKLIKESNNPKLMIIHPVSDGFNYMIKKNNYDLSLINRIDFFDYYLTINNGDPIFYDGIIGFNGG